VSALPHLSAPLAADIAKVFTGERAYMGERFVLDSSGRETVPCAALLDPAVLGAIFSRYERLYPGADRKGVVSLWAQWYFGILVPPALCLDLLLDRVPRLALDRVRLVLDGSATPAAFVLEDVSEGQPEDAFMRFSPLIDGHVEPVVNALADFAKVSPRVMWSNAGNMFEWMVAELAKELGPRRTAVEQGLEFIASKALPDGRRNRVHEPVRYIERDGQPLRQRKICCLRYMLPGFETCDNCPTPGLCSSPN
jgi:ferric iron reductase protein FhuF